VLVEFCEIARLKGDLSFVERCQKKAAQLRGNLQDNGWDGEWYLRAYFDDGSALGSAKNPECRIDSIAQSWSVLSGAGNDERSHMSMEAVDKLLVRRDYNLVQLLSPPFDKSELNPGYIKGYVPGVRENGGQYTHAAIWVAMAFAQLGDSSRAWEVMEMLNPVNHGESPEKIADYKVEPYVVAADVYAESPHIGRGGWSWYTGSAGWMYRLILESLLGLRLETDKLSFAPCLPGDWESFKMHYRYRETVYHIIVLQTRDGSMASVTADGVEQSDMAISLVDDQREHSAEIRIPAQLHKKQHSQENR
jgi:cyclic beta-1,2-glucan synthetase